MMHHTEKGNSTMSMTMSRGGRLAALAGLGVAAALALSACAPPGASTDESAAPTPGGDAATGTLKVGFLSPTSGNFAVAGQEMLDGWNLYWEENGNEVNGVTIETIAEDDAGNPETALTKAHKLVEQDGVDIVVGPLIASTASAVAAYTAPLGIPNLHPVAASNDLTQQNWNDFTVRTGSMGGTQSTYPGGVWAATEGGYSKAVTLCHDYSFGWESCAGFVQGFVENGGEIVQQIWAPNTTTDWGGYAAQVQAALAGGADVVFVALAGGAGGPGFLTAYLDAGGSIEPLLLNCCAADQGTLRAMGDRIIGMKSVSYWAEGRDAEVTREFVDAYIAKTGQVPGAYIAGGYITASLLAQVIEERGLLTGADLIDAITSYTFEDSIFGKVSWDEYNNTIAPVYIREVQKGEDGLLYNVPIAEFEDVDQWLGKGAPADVRSIVPYDQTNQGL